MYDKNGNSSDQPVFAATEAISIERSAHITGSCASGRCLDRARDHLLRAVEGPGQTLPNDQSDRLSANPAVQLAGLGA